MTPFTAWITTLTGRLLPKGLPPDPEDRPRTLALMLGVFFSSWLLLLGLKAALGYPAQVLVTIAMAGLPFPVLAGILRRGHLRTAAWGLCLSFAGALSLAAWRLNGANVLTMPWALLLPVVATYLVGWRGGLLFAAGWVAQLAVYGVLDRPDVPIRAEAMGISTAIMLPLGVLVTAIYQRRQERARGNLLAALREKERSDLEREASETSLQQLIERAPELILVQREGRIVYANRKMVESLGHTSMEALRGSSLLALVHPEQRAEAEARVERNRQGLENPAAEFRLVRVDGTLLYCEFNSFLAPYLGEPSVIAFGRDITERLALNARLALSDRMASVGTLAAGVAHELNNPLAFVSANLTYVRGELERLPALPQLAERPEWLQALAEAQDGARRMKGIILDLKTYSGASENNVETIDVCKVIQGTLRLAENEIRHRALLEMDLSSEAFVRASEARLGQVILNLVVNAVQSMAAGDADHHRLRVVARVEGAQVVITLTDTGCGISPQHLSRIFDPFFTTKPIGEGAGLGLFICHNLVVAMGGELRMQSEVGQGTTVTVVLPAQPAPNSQASRPEDPADAPRRPRVLVVDDEPLVGRGVRRTLMGHEVVFVQTAAEALALLKDGPPFDAILCDLMMPEMDGAEFFSRLERQSPQLLPKVLFLTAGAFTRDAQAFLDSGKAWLAKPYESEELRRAIRALATGTRILAA
ncbi:MAG: ATP-binding protein [Myxococcota bacterium]|nr:ATP-binding protein [Myxococcota bacterium]